MTGGTAAIEWSTQKQKALRDQLSGFWAQDEWDLRQSPLHIPGTDGCPRARFTCSSAGLNSELKYACWQKLASGTWRFPARTHISRIHCLIAWLNQVAADAPSLLSRGRLEWELSLRTYLHEQGKWRCGETSQLDHTQRPRTYVSDDSRLSTFRQLYRVVEEAYDERSEYDRDIWDLRDWGLQTNLSQPPPKLNFAKLEPLWLRHAAKRYMRYKLSVNSAADTVKKLEGLRTFGSFLRQHPTTTPGQIDRALILEYLSYLSSSGLAAKTRTDYILALRDFLELCAREGWDDLPERRLIYDEDLPRRREPQPRFIPHEVLRQLDEHLHDLPDGFRRMVLILRECGMRISELCMLPTGCLWQDSQGDWFLRYYQGKMKKEHNIPIGADVAAVIQEQRQAVRERWGQDFALLFPGDRGQPVRQQTFLRALNRLAYDKRLRDATGRLWRFQSHQFRHTVGTSMINNGVPQHIVQRYLGHESPEMTSVYAHIHDQTLKREFDRFRERMVNAAGRVVEADDDNGELQWFKRNILAQALPNGHCFLPLAAGPCPHANACLTCAHFRTDIRFLPQHKTQLAETASILDKARDNAWTRQIEMNEQVKRNLESIIETLEEGRDGAPAER